VEVVLVAEALAVVHQEDSAAVLAAAVSQAAAQAEVGKRI
jgi:hypothetical protein